MSAMVVGFSSCEKHIEEDIDSNPNEEYNNNTSSIETNIKNNVTINLNYNDYYLYTTIHSTLSSAISSKSVKFGIEFGYGGAYAYEQYCQNFNGNSGTIKSTIFFDCGKYKFSGDELYAKAYLELRDKIAQGKKLDSDENNLYKNCIKYLNNDEPIAKREYNAKIFVDIDSKRYYIKTVHIDKSIETSQNNSGGNTGGSIGNNTSSKTGKHNGYEWVDLGLSVKWATCNVGASTPEASGDYYAWGSIDGYNEKNKIEHNWKTYFDTYDEGKTFVKYSLHKKDEIEQEDDVAHVKWGGSWRMPKSWELYELRSGCNWDWDYIKNCYKVTSKKNGESIFLPAAGYSYLGHINLKNDHGVYWSSNLKSDTEAYYLNFDSENVATYISFNRCVGMSVRPVYPN